MYYCMDGLTLAQKKQACQVGFCGLFSLCFFDKKTILFVFLVNLAPNLDHEKAANRFAGAFLIPPACAPRITSAAATRGTTAYASASQS